MKQKKQEESQMSDAVADMSEEDFDKNFDAMMNQSPEEFDASTQQSEETQLAESPSVEEETQPVDEPEDNEQPQEELDTPTEPEPDATGEPEEVEEESPVDEDSQEPTEYDFTGIPRDKIIPKDINVNGMKVRATMDELEAGFKKGMNYTQKMQEIAPHRKDMNLMMDNGLTTADLNLLVEAKGGNKEALAKLLGDAKVDPLDIETDDGKEYTPKDYSKEVPNVEMEQVKSEILQDTEFSPQVENALQTMPEDMYNMVSDGAGKMNALYSDIKSGLYAKAMPEVLKQQALNGQHEPTIDTYLKVAQQFIKQAPQEKATTPVNNTELNAKRKNAATTPQSKPSEKKSLIKEDLDTMSDEDFEASFQKMVGRSINDFN